MPEHFYRYVMQANDLEGALFEAINKEKVSVETTHIKTYE
jgi:hypothetical protein